ncbi:hypothetical protein GGD64_008066 [Bradyrhizobium sp. CIR3A]|nr:hypothetical protein [Bradyrhizobium sp. CIR3A]
MQHKNETFSGGGTITSQLEMAGRMSASLTRSLEEAVGCLGIHPILADKRNALSHGASNLREQFAESVAEPRVPKVASTTLSINRTFTFQGRQTVFGQSIH